MRSLVREPYFIPGNYYGGLASVPDRDSLKNSPSNQSYEPLSDYALDMGLKPVTPLQTRQGLWRIWRNESLDISPIAPLPKAGVDVAVYDPNEGLRARHLVVGIGGAGFSSENGFKQVLEAASNHLVERPGYFKLPKVVSDNLILVAGAVAVAYVGVEVGPAIVDQAEIQGKVVGGTMGTILGGGIGVVLSELDERRIARKIPRAAEYRADDRAMDNLIVLRNRLVEAVTFFEVVDSLGDGNQGLSDRALWKIYTEEGSILKLAERRVMERREERDPRRRSEKMEVFALDRMTRVMEDRIDQHVKVGGIKAVSDARVAAIVAGKGV